jgi:hypothetical protein
MRKLRFLFMVALVIALLSMTAVVSAQDDESDTCDYATFSDSLTEQIATLADEEDPAAALRDIQSQIGEFQAACAGLSFSSEEYGLQPVLGPLTIPEGVYRLTLTTDGAFILSATILGGECDELDYLGLFLIFPGTAAEGAQTVLDTGECEVLLQISNVSDPWTLTFEKLR